MSCELYNDLTDYSIVSVTREPICRHQVECSQTAENCKFQGLLKRVDLRSRLAAETQEDRNQSRILAELEAARNLIVSPQA